MIIENLVVETILSMIISSLLTGACGLALSYYVYFRLEKRKLKVETAKKLFGNKHDTSGAAFCEAVHEIMVVFSDSPDVMEALREFSTLLNCHQAQRQKLLMRMPS